LHPDDVRAEDRDVCRQPRELSKGARHVPETGEDAVADLRPKISDKEMLGILQERAKAGVEIRVIGSVAGRAQFDVQRLAGIRLHTRTIIRDRRRAFIGSQSLRIAELDSRRELGLIVQDAKAVKSLIETFESDSARTSAHTAPVRAKEPDAPMDEPTAVSEKEAEKAVQVLTKELDPLAVSVKQAVRKAVAKAGEDVLHDKDVKNTMKKRGQKGREGSRQRSGPRRSSRPGSQRGQKSTLVRQGLVKSASEGCVTDE
jgi:PLD-like domain